VLGIFLVVVAARTDGILRAEEVAWGTPVGRLQIGIASATQRTPANRQPVFTIILKNTSRQTLTIPAASAYMEKSHVRFKGWHMQPLHPKIETVEGAQAAPSMGDGADVKTVGMELVTLEPGQSLTLPDMPLVENGYCSAGCENYHGLTHRTTWWLLPENTYRIRFFYENEQAEVAGKKVWTGKTESGPLTLRVTALPLDDFKVKGGFSLMILKDEYFVGEPIYVIFEVTNTGEIPFSFASGGDYRSSGRHDRFSFTAVDENGEAVPDPIARFRINGAIPGGGIGGEALAKPGKTYSERLLVNQWCAFTQPGRYTITCKRMLNLSADPKASLGGLEMLRPALPVETKITITLRRDDRALAKYVESLGATLSGYEHYKAYEEMSVLARAQFEAVLPIISRLARSKGPVQEKAMQWLSYFDKEKAIPVFMDLIKSSDPKVRMEALRILAEWQVKDVGTLVQDALRSPDASERSAAVILCWRSKYADCLPLLLEMADDKDSLVRQYLGSMLAVYGDQRAVPVLLKLLRDPDSNSLTKLGAAVGLGKLGRKDGIAVLIDLLQRDEMKGMRGNIYAALEELTGTKRREDPDEWQAWWQKEGKAKF
jgi:hypothetical protein